MTERIIQANGLQMATGAFGDPAHPPVLLITGGGASMLWWPQAFCERLANLGRYVIRYDQHETYPPRRRGHELHESHWDTIVGASGAREAANAVAAVVVRRA